MRGEGGCAVVEARGAPLAKIAVEEREDEVAVGPMRSKRGQWPTPCQGAPSSTMQVQTRTNVRFRAARDEIQLSQSATQAANREGSGDSLRLTPDWLRTGYSNGRGE